MILLIIHYINENIILLFTISPASMSILKPSFTSTNVNNVSNFTENKSRSKRKNTFVNSISRQILKFDNIDESLQMLRISLKKESDRRNKLKKLLDKYCEIFAQDKKHVKQIKSSIIEMKDATATCKLRLLVDPSILVENSIKVETRQFLCALLNTFYRTYEENEKNNEKIVSFNGTISYLIKGISFNQDLIFLMQKTQMNEQVQLESELLAEKNKLKQEIQRKKQIRQQYESVKRVYADAKQRHQRKQQVISGLENHLRQLSDQESSLKQRIQQQQTMRSESQDKLDTEMFYQQKLQQELSKIDSELEQKNRESRVMMKKLVAYKSQSQFRKTNSRNKTLGEQAKQKIKFEIECSFKNLRS